MKLLVFSLLLLVPLLSEAQKTALFNNKVKLHDGIYTTTDEILSNSPKFPEIKIEAKSDFWIGGYTNLYYFDSSGKMNEYNDTLIFLVYDGQRFVYYKYDFHKLIQTGAVSTFIIERVYVDYRTGYVTDDSKLLFWDLETGKIDKLTPKKFEEILQRDNEIYETYSRIPKSRQKETLYYYLLKYNERNPVYIDL